MKQNPPVLLLFSWPDGSHLIFTFGEWGRVFRPCLVVSNNRIRIDFRVPGNYPAGAVCRTVNKVAIARYGKWDGIRESLKLLDVVWDGVLESEGAGDNIGMQRQLVATIKGNPSLAVNYFKRSGRIFNEKGGCKVPGNVMRNAFALAHLGAIRLWRKPFKKPGRKPAGGAGDGDVKLGYFIPWETCASMMNWIAQHAFPQEHSEGIWQAFTGATLKALFASHAMIPDLSEKEIPQKKLQMMEIPKGARKCGWDFWVGIDSDESGPVDLVFRSLPIIAKEGED
jgi:hypothetical protein